MQIIKNSDGEVIMDYLDHHKCPYAAEAGKVKVREGGMMPEEAETEVMKEFQVASRSWKGQGTQNLQPCQAISETSDPKNVCND